MCYNVSRYFGNVDNFCRLYYCITGNTYYFHITKAIIMKRKSKPATTAELLKQAEELLAQSKKQKDLVDAYLEQLEKQNQEEMKKQELKGCSLCLYKDSSCPVACENSTFCPKFTATKSTVIFAVRESVKDQLFTYFMN